MLYKLPESERVCSGICTKAFYFFSNNVGSIHSIVFFTMKSRYVAFNESDLDKYSKFYNTHAMDV